MTTPDTTPTDGGADPRYRAFVDGAPLAYVSDYLSFVGADAAGRVCFTLDTNRGFDADPPKANTDGKKAHIGASEARNQPSSLAFSTSGSS